MRGASGSRLSTRELPIIARRGRSAPDLKTGGIRGAAPRRRVPVLVDDDLTLAESAAIVEYIGERWPSGPALFARDPRQRASGAWCARLTTILPTWPALGVRRGLEGPLNARGDSSFHGRIPRPANI